MWQLVSTKKSKKIPENLLSTLNLDLKCSFSNSVFWKAVVTLTVLGMSKFEI